MDDIIAVPEVQRTDVMTGSVDHRREYVSKRPKLSSSMRKIGDHHGISITANSICEIICSVR